MIRSYSTQSFQSGDYLGENWTLKEADLLVKIIVLALVIYFFLVPSLIAIINLPYAAV